MEFKDFKNILKQKNINLFDHDYRIAYHVLTNGEQKGGGYSGKLFNNKTNNEMKDRIGLALSDNFYFLSQLKLLDITN